MVAILDLERQGRRRVLGSRLLVASDQHGGVSAFSQQRPAARTSPGGQQVHPLSSDQPSPLCQRRDTAGDWRVHHKPSRSRHDPCHQQAALADAKAPLHVHNFACGPPHRNPSLPWQHAEVRCFRRLVQAQGTHRLLMISTSSPELYAPPGACLTSRSNV